MMLSQILGKTTLVELSLILIALYYLYLQGSSAVDMASPLPSAAAGRWSCFSLF